MRVSGAEGAMLRTTVRRERDVGRWANYADGKCKGLTRHFGGDDNGWVREIKVTWIYVTKVRLTLD